MSASITSLSLNGSIQKPNTAKRKKRKIENFASISSSIMLKLPTKNLGSLRSLFMEKPNGLNLTEFLEAVINNMELSDVSNLMLMISDLTDFFQLVDINGDGVMEWEEFVMFILDAVVPNKEGGLQEMFDAAGTVLLQPPSSREIVHVVRMIPAINQLVVGIGSTLQFYHASEYDLALSTLTHSFRVVEDTESRTTPPYIIIDVTYVQSQDIVCVLKDNLSATFYKLRAPTNINGDTIVTLGTHYFGQPYSRLLFRDLPHLETRVFGIYTSATMDSYKCAFSKWKKPEFSHPKPLSKHKDYIRDALIISTQQFKFICSGGLDKTVHFWDLEDLKYKFARTGPKSGIQCLAFDGIRLVLGGGFDYTIIGWDLYATLDQPALHLTGHKYPVYRIVPIGPNERCCTLDESGVLCWWDSSLTTPSDDQRLITTTEVPHDRIKDFDLYLNCGVNFNTQHGCVVAAAGRKQMTYRIADFSPNESAPIALLYSKTLLSVVTVHLTDIIFWSVISADRHKSLNNIYGTDSHTRAVCAALDDRGRKLYVGDTDGHICIYNCLNGLKLKSLFIMPNAAIKNIIYTMDKYLVVIAGSSDLLIVDEYYTPPPVDPFAPPVIEKDIKEPVTSATDVVLRQVVAHENECRAVAYCEELGLIATIDTFGELCLWDYQFLNLISIFKDCADGNDVGEIGFLLPFPLLFVTSNSGEFILVSVAPKSRWNEPDNHIYRMKPRLSRRRQYSADDDEDIMTALDRMETQYSSMALDSTAAQNKLDDEPDEAELTGARSEPYNRKKIGRFQKKRNREVTSFCFHIEESDVALVSRTLDHSQDFTRPPGSPAVNVTIPPPTEHFPSVGSHKKDAIIDDPDIFSEQFEHELHDGEDFAAHETHERGFIQTNVNVNDNHDDVIVVSGSEEVKRVQIATHIQKRKKELEDARRQSQEASSMLLETRQYSTDILIEERGRGVENRKMRLVLGHNDGTISVLDITEVLREMDTSEILQKDSVRKEANFNPSRRILKGAMRGDEVGKTWSEESIRDRERVVACDFVTVWRPHDASISQLSIIGDYNYIITASEDASVYLWTMEASFRGTLTRGRDMDRVFRKTWEGPVDLEARDIRRQQEAEKLIREHNLLQEGGDSICSNNEHTELEETTSSFIRLTRSNLASREVSRTTAHRRAGVVGLEVGEGDGSQSLISFADTTRTFQSLLATKKKQFCDVLAEFTIPGIPTEEELQRVTKEALHLPERDRLIGQLKGAITYQPSKKEFAQMIVGDKTQAAVEEIRNGQEDNKKITSIISNTQPALQLTGGVEAPRGAVTEDAMDNERYYQTIREADAIIAAKSAERVDKMKKWEHEQEMAEIDAKDPDNWDLKSYNRKREMYAHWFSEMTKGGVINDRMNLIKAKLDALSGVGNFQQYAHDLAARRKQERELLIKKEHDKTLKRLVSMTSLTRSNIDINEESNNYDGTKSIDFDDPAHKTAFSTAGISAISEDNEVEDDDVFTELRQTDKVSTIESPGSDRKSSMANRKLSVKNRKASTMASDRRASRRDNSNSSRRESLSNRRSSRLADINSLSRRQSVMKDKVVGETESERLGRVRREEMENAQYNKNIFGKKYSVAYTGRKKSEQVIHAKLIKVEKLVATVGHLGQEPAALMSEELRPPGSAPPLALKNIKHSIAPQSEDSIQWFETKQPKERSNVVSAPASNAAELGPISQNGLVKYSSMGNINLSKNMKHEKIDVSKGRYDRSAGYVNITKYSAENRLPHIRSGTGSVETPKQTWRLTSSHGADVGIVIGTKDAEPKTFDPIFSQNEKEYLEKEEEFRACILSSPLRSRLSSPGALSDDGSMQWNIRSRTPSPSMRTRSPVVPAQVRPFTPPVKNNGSQPITVPFSCDMAVDASVPINDSPSSQHAVSPMSRAMTLMSHKTSSFVHVLTSDEARLQTKESLKKFESIVKPITEKQYLRLVEKTDIEENGSSEQKKRKKRKKKRKNSDIPARPDKIIRLKPIDIETIQAYNADVDKRRDSPNGRRSPGLMARNSSGYYGKTSSEDFLYEPIDDAKNKQASIELAWIKKVKYALNTEEKPRRDNRRGSVVMDSLMKVKFKKLSSTVGAAPDAREAENDKRILSRLSFGSCKVEDLLRLRDAFVEVARVAAVREIKDTMDLTNIDTVDLPAAMVEGKFKFEPSLVVSIPAFLDCAYIKSKKGFKKILKKYVEGLELRGKLKLTIDMKTILKQLFPLMPQLDLRDCVRYFVLKESSGVDREKKQAPLTEEELRKLREMFDYFDRDKSGAVDPSEIMEMLNQGKSKKISVMDAEFTIAEKDVDSNNVMDLVKAVDQDENAELDFEEFCVLFREAFQ